MDKTIVNDKPQRDGWKALFRTIKKLRLPWLWIAVGLAVNILLNSFLLDLPNMTADLLSGNLSGTTTTKAIFFYVEVGLLSLFAFAGQAQAQSYSVRKARESIWRRMLGMKMDYFDRHDPSDLMSAITNDASAAVTNFVNIILYLIPDIYYVVAALLRINEYHWILALSCFAMLPLKYLYALVMGKKMQVASARVYGRIGVLTGYLADRISHLPLIKTYTNEKAESANGEKAADGLYDANMKLVKLDNISTAIIAVLDILQKFIVIVVAVILLQRKEIDIAMWLAFFLFAQNLFPNMDEIFSMWIKIKGMHGEFHRIIEIMAGDTESGEGTAFPAEGDIRFENVTFSYPDTDSPAIENASFTVPRGSALAIVGLCGSGKTTSISLLERFYTPDEGHVYIGDTDVSELSLHDFRSRLAYVQQGADVFSGTLREALTYGISREVSDGEIFAAAEKTGFSEYLALCGNDLSTEVAAGGQSMSGGQGQRLVLTREVLRGGDIILMDEPTSALDVRVSAKIQDTIDELFAGKTRILITHDLDYARRYDRIIVMENGRIVGDGSHESLLRDCETYRAMNAHAGEEAAI